MKTILAAVEFRKDEAPILNCTAEMARAFQAPVYLLHVEPPEPDFVGYHPGPQYIRDHVAQQAQADHELLHVYRDQLRQQGIEGESLLIQGPTAQKVVEEARRLEAACIIVGSHGHGVLHDLFWGSVSEGIIRKAPCPVLVVPTSAEIGG
ncbi:MAG: universal stress protein [Candidatus Hydrogenedentes bacterium]|nr:universal stress protein [Candidatus Hydrogenedentota bacterium]